MGISPIIRRIVSLFGHGALVAIVALAGLALTPQSASAQGGASTKSKAFNQWRLLCREKACAAAHRGTRAVLIFGYNTSDGKLVMQVRLPPDSAENKPMVLRLHKSGALLHLNVDACGKAYCTAAAAAGRTSQVIKMFKKEVSGSMAYQLGQQLQIEVFSLRGFAKALDELAKHKP